MGVREIDMYNGNLMVEIDTPKGFKTKISLKKAVLCANNAAAILALQQSIGGSTENIRPPTTDALGGLY